MAQTGYCTAEDVRTALQEVSLSGPTDTEFVDPEIIAASTWLRKTSGRHFYDSEATTDPLATGARSIETVRLDVPSSPHAQRGQIHAHDRGVRYPVTSDGPYTRLPLPHAYVESLDALKIRDRDGGVTDWTADPEYEEGVGADYYVQEENLEGRGASYLYLRATAIGTRRDYAGLVVADYQYGLDEQTESWADVRRGVANLAAAELVVDDDVLSSLPDNGQLVSLDTQADRLLERGMKYLRAYL
jgi:hypothetical protein